MSFETNGGSKIDPIKVSDPIQYLPTPTKKNHIFDGWCYDKTLMQKVMTPLKITQDKTLYAKWIEQFTVRFDTNGGTWVDSIITTNYINYSPSTTKDNHVFDGWYYDLAFTNKATFPLCVKNSTTLYAKWIKTSYTATCNDRSIKDWGSNSSKISYDITPTGFDLKALEEKGYKVSISVSYDVYYRKDYDVPFDVGYVGAPKYEIYLDNARGVGPYEEDIKATKSSVTKNISYTYPISALNDITLTFSTNNKQNIIYFENIKITYTCIK